MRRPVRIGDMSIVCAPRRADGIAMGDETAEVFIERWSLALSACISGTSPIAPVDESLQVIEIVSEFRLT